MTNSDYNGTNDNENISKKLEGEDTIMLKDNDIGEDGGDRHVEEVEHENVDVNGDNRDSDFFRKLFANPTKMDEEGNEFAIFDDVTLNEGCKKWELTMCGYFVGHNMTVTELRYILRKMWGRKGFKDIIDVNNGDIHVCLDRREPKKIPIWVRMCNVPLKAWTTNSISALASRLGNPLVMDNTTAEMFKPGVGRVGYERVLVEVGANKCLPEEIEVV
nr:RNA-directed DNA polymerase, eukaryota, reverse transcriptase zinc-binding domain protein [Tanacetum cinerariifolium]